MRRSLIALLVVIALAPLSAQQSFRVFRQSQTGGSAVGPSIVVTTPSENPYSSQSLSQLLGGIAVAGTAALTRVDVVCTGATSLTYRATGTVVWGDVKSFNVGTTDCVITVTDAAALTATDSQRFILTNPDVGSPVVSAGVDASTTGSTYQRTVSCTDAEDGHCDTVSWRTCTVSDAGTYGAGCLTVADASAKNGTCQQSVNIPTDFPCTFTLVSSGGLTTANTIIVTGTDTATPTPHSSTDIVVITRTVDLRITSPSGLGSCTLDVLCTLSAITSTGGTTGTYTYDNNSGGSSLTGYETACTGLSVASNGVISGTVTTANVGDGVCNPTIRVNDGVTTATAAFSIPLFAAGATYFATIAARGDAMVIPACDPYESAGGCSLQSAAELMAIAQNPTASHTQAYTYDTSAEAGPGGAAKLTWLQDAYRTTDQSNIPNPDSTLRVPVNTYTGTILGIWDWKPGISWSSAGCSTDGKIPELDTRPAYGHKEKQFAMSSYASGSTKQEDGINSIQINIEMTAGGRRIVTDCTEQAIGVMSDWFYMNDPTDVRTFGFKDTQMHPPRAPSGGESGKYYAGDGTVEVQSHHVKYGVWTRYWFEVRMNVDASAFTSWNTRYGVTVPPGTYHMVSIWLWDETMSAPKRIIYKAPIQRQTKSTSITSITRVGSTVTITLPVKSHGVANGETLNIIDSPIAAYNGDWDVLSGGPTTTTVTFTATGAALTAADCNPCTGARLNAARNGIAMFWFEHNTSSSHVESSGPAKFTCSAAPTTTITGISTGTQPTITATNTFVNGDKVVIADSNSTPSIDGTYKISSVTSTSFKITAKNAVTVAGSAGTATRVLIPANTVLTRAITRTTPPSPAPAPSATWKYQVRDDVIACVGGEAIATVEASPAESFGGPEGDAAAGTTLTMATTLSSVSSTATVQAPGLQGGRYLHDGDLISFSRWFNLLHTAGVGSSALTDGSDAADDVVKNPVIFQKPR